VPKFVYDTNIYISKLAEKMPPLKTLYDSSVVLFERMTSANNRGEYNKHLGAWQQAEKDKLLIIPNREDWKLAGQISYLLAQERKAQAGGKSPKLSSKVKQEIALDCLIAVSAAREGVTVVTTNNADFDAIKRHCKNLQVMVMVVEEEEKGEK
jgi:predicted nucleic acid-binding protein